MYVWLIAASTFTILFGYVPYPTSIYEYLVITVNVPPTGYTSPLVVTGIRKSKLSEPVHPLGHGFNRVTFEMYPDVYVEKLQSIKLLIPVCIWQTLLSL